MRAIDLIAELEREAAHLKIPWEIRACPAYARVRNRAPVDALLVALKDAGNPLPIMLLLGEIVGRLPYPARDAGNLHLMRDAWLRWAKTRHSAQNSASS